MTRPELLVMAAGLGSRFGGLKQLEPIGPDGEKVMDYSLFDAKRAGIERVVFVIRREFESDFHKHVGSRFARWMDIAYAFQEIDLLPHSFSVPYGRLKPWGTAHAILSAKDIIKNPFIAINADDFYGAAAFCALAEWLSAPVKTIPEQYAMVVFQMANTLSPNGTVARGVCEIDERGLLGAVREYSALEAFEGGARDIPADGSVTVFTGLEPVSMNFWGFRPSLFAYLEELFVDFLIKRGQELKSEFYIPCAVDELIKTERAEVHALRTPDPWFGVTYREDKEFVAARVRELIKSGKYPHSLWSS